MAFPCAVIQAGISLFPAVFVHGVHGLVAAAEAVLIDTGLKAHDVPETVERAAGAEASMPETAEDVDVLHRAVRGQKEHIHTRSRLRAYGTDRLRWGR